MEAKHIKVETWPLSDLIVDIGRGKLRIPQFQRDFVWEKPRVTKLLDSMYKDFPIGSFFFWIAPKEYNIFYRDIPELDIKHSDNDTEVTFILDGQQRITSLYATLKGLTIRKTNYYDICFDLDKELFVARKGDHLRYIPFADFFGNNHLEIYNSLTDERKTIFQKCRDKFNNYPFSIIIVKDKNIEQVCEIFERLNQSGKKLDLFDLVVANTWDKEFKLKDEIDDLNKIFLTNFGKLKNEIFVQSISLIKKKQCNRAYQLKLTKEDFINTWKEFSEALKKTIDFIKNNLGVKRFEIIPYPSLIPLIVYFYYNSKTLNNHQRQKIEEWFWKCSFSERYSSSTLTRMGEDRNLFDKLLNGEEITIPYPLNIGQDKLKKTNITSRSALRNTLLCLLAKKNPMSFKDNSPIILDKDYFSTLSSPEKHHIFPKKFLEKTKEINSILNFCFIPSSLNKEISKKKPSDYFTEYKKNNPKFGDSLKTHLINPEEGSAIWINNYDSFLVQRGETILNEIKNLVGDLTILEKEFEENPKKILEVIENQIREKIHTNLYESYGENYWEEFIPQDVKENVQNRVKDTLKRQPFLKEEYEQPQNKLSKCDLMDYPKIILKNWKIFEDIFGSKEEINKHFKNLNEFRKAIAHSNLKKMNSITRKEGEIAVEWLSQALKYDELPEEIQEENEDNELFERLKEKIKTLGEDISIEPKAYYTAFKLKDIKKSNFIALKIRRDELVLYLKGENFKDPKEMLRDVSDVGHHGTGRYQLKLVSISDLDYAIELITSAYNQIKDKKMKKS